jgi:hypothetical protein
MVVVLQSLYHAEREAQTQLRFLVRLGAIDPPVERPDTLAPAMHAVSFLPMVAVRSRTS